MTLPLDGLLVADFSRVLAGPLAAATLADLGAEVIKVERPGVGDDTRHWGPPWTATSSSYFECANRSKESVELDLADPGDLAVAHELAGRCDVLIENFRAGTLDRYGLGYDAVAARNPGVVYASITGFGSAEGADLAGYDFLVQAVGGLMSITGPPGEPTKAGVALVDVLTSKDAVVGILAALRARETIGRGQRVEVNLLSSLLGSLANQASAYLATGSAPGAMGNQHPSIAPTRPCKLETATSRSAAATTASSPVSRPRWAGRSSRRTRASRPTATGSPIAMTSSPSSRRHSPAPASRPGASGSPLPDSPSARWAASPTASTWPRDSASTPPSPSARTARDRSAARSPSPRRR